MTDQKIAVSGNAAPGSGVRRPTCFSRSRHTDAGDVLPFLPNLLATIASFGFMVVVPWLSVLALEWIKARYDLIDDLDSGVIDFLASISILELFGLALLFLVIGMALQFRQHLRPFASWWPVALAFPVIWILLLPEAWVRGDSVRYWLLVGSGIAVAFAVHWVSLLIARDAME